VSHRDLSARPSRLREIDRARGVAREAETSPDLEDIAGSLDDGHGPLIRLGGSRGPEIVCPVCEVPRPFMQYTPLRISQKHARYVLPVFRCPTVGCRHVFALNPNPEVTGATETAQEEGRQADEPETEHRG
jgi:hypothetical protein